MSDRARAYHEATKHSYQSVRMSGRSLDWDRKPDPVKRYRDGARRRPLPRAEGFPEVPAAVALRRPAGPDGTEPTGSALGSVLWLGAGAHRRWNLGGEEVRFRTYASAGALYPNEVYAAVGDLEGLPAGLYHLDPVAPALTLLRDRDPRPSLLRAAAEHPAVGEAPVTLVLTGILWRTGWKYGERGYRHLFWDAGMIVTNLLAASSALGLPARVVTGFVDGEVEALLGIDAAVEAPLCLVALGTGAGVSAAKGPPEPVEVAAGPVSGEDFPMAREAHEAGRLHDPGEVRAWRQATVPSKDPTPVEGVRPRFIREATDPIDRVILRRGSARGFLPGAMPLGVLGSVLGAAARSAPSDAAPAPVEAFLAAHAVEDLAPGSYRFRSGAFQPLREGDVRRKAAFLCLEQRLGGEGAATAFLLGDLDGALAAWGDRGYRVAQLAGGVAGGRMYLGAYGLGWGATGLTFYDDEVTRFFEPDAAGMEPLLVVAVGESVGRSDLRPAR